MTCAAWHPIPISPSIRKGVLGFLFSLATTALCTQGATAPFSFADGRITCELNSEKKTLPSQAVSILPVAMKVALQEVGTPDQPAHLTIHLEGKPSFWQRIRSLFEAETFAIQEGDTLRLHSTDHPLKLSFRMAHEFSHWLVFKQYSTRPPLWLDEGLAQEVGATAAAIIARTQSKKLERPIPSNLKKNSYTLDELTALRDYPKRDARIAAFYWQAEALVRALRKRLGPSEFALYLELLASPHAPDWQAPLRERWYFNDGDFDWLSRQIQPRPPINTDASPTPMEPNP